MSNDKQKPGDSKGPPPKGKSVSAPGPAAAAKAKPIVPPPPAPPPLFRRVDWFTFGITALLVFIGYYLTLAPDLTLEDSGELAVGSFYAAVPHPPGYPVWTLYTWLFTVLVPFSNIAWRVALSSAVAGALSCGLIGLLVSRGSSMILEGISEFKSLEQKWESALCVVSGCVAGMLLGFNGFMWSQAVIVEVYPFSVLSLMGVLCCLLRWMYAPVQMRYLYWAAFLFGVCFTNHQTLIVAAVGIEVAVLAAQPKLGRDLFLANSVIFILGLVLKANKTLTMFDANPALYHIYLLIGIGSMATYAWLACLTMQKVEDWMALLRDNLVVIGGAYIVYLIMLTAKVFEADGSKLLGMVIHICGTGALLAFVVPPYLSKKSKEPGTLPKWGGEVLILTAVYIVTLWRSSSGKLNWYYDSPSYFLIHNFIGLCLVVLSGRVLMRVETFGTVVFPIVKLGTMWLLGISFYFYMPLASMTNPPMNWGYARTVEGFFHALSRGQYEKANPTNIFNDPLRFIKQLWHYGGGTMEEFNFIYLLIALVPFFFYFRMQKRERAWIAGLSAIFLCLGVLLMILLNPQPDRQSQGLNRVFFTASYVIISMFIGYGLTLIGATLATGYERFRGWAMWACVAAAAVAFYTFVDLQNMATAARAAVLFGLALALCSVAVFGLIRERVPMVCLIGMMAVMPAYSILSHWADNEQRGHLFGYWFGHDMFTPPFKAKNNQALYPEMARNAVLFGGTDPGRFNPTYMIFCESFIPARCKPRDPVFDRRDVYLITQNALADATYLNYIRAHYNRSEQKDPLFFSELLRSGKERERNSNTNLLARAVKPLDTFFTNLGQRIEDRRRLEGVYPPKEIITPTPADSQQAFQDYVGEAQVRFQHDLQSPNEPKQIKPGEDVHLVDNRITVSGQVAVMAINGLLTKVIFDKNPGHEFYVEESFPLDWMFHHLTPFGIIMKINRQPLAEMTQEIVDTDHAFWTQYSERLIGNWITYDTSVSNICAFAEKAYLNHVDTGLPADPKFLRDDNAQKAFSKLRSALGGLYAWRINHCADQLRQPRPVAEQQRLLAEQKRMIKEADFAYRQSFAFCPYSPEATFRYINLLISLNRADDALLIARTCWKLDPANDNIKNLVDQLENIVKQMKSQAGATTTSVPAPAAPAGTFAALESQYRADPANVTNAVNLFSAYLEAKNTQQASAIIDQLVTNPNASIQTLLSADHCYDLASQPAKRQAMLARAALIVEQHLANPQADAGTLMNAAQVYALKQDGGKLEAVLARLVKVTPNNPEAWYDLATVQAALGKNPAALLALNRALTLSTQRLKQDPKARNLQSLAAQDSHFVNLRPNPDFQKLLQTK